PRSSRAPSTGPVGNQADSERQRPCSLRSRPLPAFGRTPPFHCRSTGEKSSSLAPPPGLRPNSPVPHPLPPAFGRRYLPPSLRSGGLIPRRGRNPRGAVRKKKPPGRSEEHTSEL